jgi:hypothetical protein
VHPEDVSHDLVRHFCEVVLLEPAYWCMDRHWHNAAPLRDSIFLPLIFLYLIRAIRGWPLSA